MGRKNPYFDLSLVLPVLKPEMEHEYSRDSTDFFPPHLKILDHFCHSPEAWKLCASHSFFPPSFPSSLQLKEIQKELRSYWAHCVSCGDWNHGEQDYGSCNLWEDSTGELSCSLVKEMKWLLRRRNKLSTSAWNLLSDSSAFETLKIKRINSCSKKDLLECADLHSPGTQH